MECEEDWRLEIFNSQGNRMHSVSQKPGTGIYLSGFDDGLYFLHFEFDNQLVTKKIVKM